MTGHRLPDYLGHILDAVRLARGYCEEIDREGFLADRKTQQAVIFNLLVIGEAATKICNEHSEFAAQYPLIPWKSMRGMRNRLAHGYFEIDLEIVWDTVQSAVPALESRLLELLDALVVEPTSGKMPGNQ